MTRWTHAVLLVALTLAAPIAAGPSAAQSSPGVPPSGASTCPPEHPVKIYVSRRSEAPGVYYLPGSGPYESVKPERCFASERAAREAGYKAGREERPPAADDGRSRRPRP